jgi:hypothetical protein
MKPYLMLVAALLVGGSVAFLVASILMHPTFTANPSVYATAMYGFFLGSGLFTLSGLLGLIGVKQTPLPRGTAVATATLSVLGAGLLLAGSVTYLLDLGEKGASIGTYIFRAGSCAYILSSALGIVSMHRSRTALKRYSTAERLQLSALIAYLMGASAFIAGGVAFGPSTRRGQHAVGGGIGAVFVGFRGHLYRNSRTPAGVLSRGSLPPTLEPPRVAASAFPWRDVVSR